MTMARHIDVITEGDTSEVQWRRSPAGPLEGYAQIVGGRLYVPFRAAGDEPYVFVLDGDATRIVSGEDVPPSLDALIVWRPFGRESQ